MKNFIKISFILSVSVSILLGFDYKVDGNVASVTRIGFNHQKLIDEEKGIYPNNSFWSLSAQLGIKFFAMDNLSFGFRGAVGGVAYDSTRLGSRFFPADSVSSKGQTSNAGRFSEVYMPAWGEIINAYVAYDNNGKFGIKAGRYDFSPNLDWFSGRNQGLEVFGGNEKFQGYGVYSNARSSTNSEWLNHFTPRNGKLNKIGTFVVGFNGQFDNYLINPYIYYQPGVHIAPGFKFIYDITTSSNIKSKTKFIVLGTIHDSKIRNLPSSQDWGWNDKFNTLKISKSNSLGYAGKQRGAGGVSILLREDVDLSNWNFGGGLYKNIGNPNDVIGSYGDPTGVKTWIYTLYDTGAPWSDFFGRDASNIFAFGGQKYENFSWDVIGRLTYSPRSDEQSLAFTVSYGFIEKISVSLRLEYMNDLTKKGYLLYKTYLKEDKSTNKSMAFLWINYKI